MDDLKERGDWNRLFERIRSFIPGHAGYHETEYISDSDRVLRHHLSLEMEKQKKSLQLLREELFLEGKIEPDRDPEEIIIRMEGISRQLMEESYRQGEKRYAEGFSEERLETIYGYDLSLLDHIEALNTPIDNMSRFRESPEAFDRELSILLETLDHIEAQIKRRDEIFSPAG